MPMQQQQETRPSRKRLLRVPVTNEEGAIIERKAVDTARSIAEYMRDVGMGYCPEPAIDREQVRQLVRAMGDLGRLGGLLKKLLTDDERLATLPQPQVRRIIIEALQEILANQSTLRAIIDGLKP